MQIANIFAMPGADRGDDWRHPRMDVPVMKMLSSLVAVVGLTFREPGTSLTFCSLLFSARGLYCGDEA
jgi:hypothetical protein